ncbi:rhamnogalacturonan acetylesterase [Novosphingobium sp. 1949]|uniref:Rhamnogalacturonan acetylesterase n=1 Tax=Novosphingobium organovorum TaxID=2930092 RepID=A0ABT0BD71_9SPHN|nr:rhamnogalacturonan acetylesterase [Novosphingobium organovorum]MCJ2182919.1 rhamnogalacturonan acetylesterase [Novosphingobium organovorum]
MIGQAALGATPVRATTLRAAPDWPVTIDRPASHVSDAGQGGFVIHLPVPQGTYKVTLTLGDARRPGRTTVKVESRRLALAGVATRAGERVTRSFLVAVRDARLPADPSGAPLLADHVLLDPAEAKSADWDDGLSLEFLGMPQVARIRIEPAEAPTLFLVGDSTVADQDAEPYASWGQMLPAMLDDKVVVANHAKSGGTMKSFIAQLRLSKVLAQARAGDWLFIQFAHNDQKTAWPLTYVSPDGTYPAYLRVFIAEARARGMHPVLVASPERRNFDATGRITDTLGAYAQAARRVARAEQVPLIDLNADSVTIMEALGPERAARAFAQNGADRTHTDNYGAWLMAAAVARQVRAKVPALAGHVTLGAFDPAHPPLPEAVAIAPSLTQATGKPAGN